MTDLYDLEVEQSLLGVILSKNSTYDAVFNIVKPEYFYSPAHQSIYISIVAALESGGKALPTIIAQSISESKEFESVGGVKAYISELASGFYLPTAAKDYAEIIKDLWVKRSLSDLSDQIKGGLRNKETSENIIKTIDNGIINFKSDDVEILTNACDGWKETIKEIEKRKNGEIKTLSTSLSELDKMINGLSGGKLYVLAARPAMGKTALALNISEGVSLSGGVLSFSLEMPKSELFMRIASRHSGVSIGKQVTGKLSNDEMMRICNVKMPQNLTVYDRSGVSIGDICSLSRWYKRRHDLKLITIDYLGLIQGDNRLQKVHQIEEITTKLKILSKELDVPIILLCQLSRAVEQRDDKRPQLSDLRDSGAIEQDADVVMFIYRDEYYLEKEGIPPRKEREKDVDYAARIDRHNERLENSRGKAEIIVAKNRQGFTGYCTINFNGERQEFYD